MAKRPNSVECRGKPRYIPIPHASRDHGPLVRGVVGRVGLQCGAPRPGSPRRNPVTSALHHLTAQDLCTAYQAGRLSPVEVTRAVLDRIAAFEGKLNAMYITDADGALAQAAASEQRWRRGAPLSLIDGVPITIKDNIITKGTPTPLGAASADLTPATTDAPPAARVKEAGCVVLGKTTMPDFGMLSSGLSSFHGITRNPWNTRR